MKSGLGKRKYPDDLISREIRKVKFSESRLKSNDKKHNMKSITLVVMYHPLLKSFSVIIDKNINILYIDKDVKRVFTPRPTVSFLSARELNSYLVTANLFSFERTVGSYKSKSKRCRDCNNITEADSFVCSDDQTNFKINHRFVCNDRSLIYLITCNRCLSNM